MNKNGANFIRTLPFRPAKATHLWSPPPPKTAQVIFCNSRKENRLSKEPAINSQNTTVQGYENQEKLYGSSKVQSQKYSRQLVRTYLILSCVWKITFSYLFLHSCLENKPESQLQALAFSMSYSFSCDSLRYESTLTRKIKSITLLPQGYFKQERLMPSDFYWQRWSRQQPKTARNSAHETFS